MASHYSKRMSATRISMPIKRSTKCAFLDLPGELRNTIYEYVLATPDLPCNHIKLDEASPPGASLALTCRKVHAEFIKLCHTTHQHYFATHTFVLDLTSPPWNSPRTCDLSHLTNLTISQIMTLHFEAGAYCLKLWRSETNGRWHALTEQTGESSSWRYRYSDA